MKLDDVKVLPDEITEETEEDYGEFEYEEAINTLVRYVEHQLEQEPIIGNRAREYSAKEIVDNIAFDIRSRI